MTPVPHGRPACGPSDSICVDQDTGALLVPHVWGDEAEPQIGEAAGGQAAEEPDDFLTIERSDVPPLERCLARKQGRRPWPSWARLASTPVTCARQLAVARAARALAGEAGLDAHRWQDLVDLCLSERLDVSSVLGAVPQRPDLPMTLPARLLHEDRLTALSLLLPHLRRGGWGPQACLSVGEGTYWGGAVEAVPSGEGFWSGGEGVWVRGTWRLGQTEGPCLWQRGGIRWRGALAPDMAREGAGELTLPDGTRVRGTWASDVLSGDALVIWPNRQRYYGGLSSEAPPVMHGKGRRDGADGSSLAGWFERGQLSDDRGGSFTYPRTSVLHGWRYEGPFLRGRKHGRGWLKPAAGPTPSPATPNKLEAVFRGDKLMADCAAGRLLARLFEPEAKVGASRPKAAARPPVSATQKSGAPPSA